ncbi:hypothetical protein SIL04_16995 [Bacillus cereus group sp. BfR-BA-00331]|uniref:hypothetical protein n=1 Tax=Bacillus cereus group TaxID=86661 RepID=UPI0007723B9C|nr:MULTISPECIES: hypothetical protein [Bacillus cereus group]ONG65872.1 hypothetical protein BKK44_23765 [Bacillus cereus]MDA2196239.1 hypothetical protein [Bacillus cereus group sp. Bc238]MDA2201945.1 hypothetical protein [Bacillus cereus group sp. Bc237]MDA2756986.1 hypothetical protein [Bacillus cereus group sp. Bc007]MDA2762656.1 hypothetical protein [Bacillus cereus group sp. Bc008]
MNNIFILSELFGKYMELNKQIVNDYAIAIVPTKRTRKLLINDLDMEEILSIFAYKVYKNRTYLFNGYVSLRKATLDSPNLLVLIITVDESPHPLIYSM